MIRFLILRVVVPVLLLLLVRSMLRSLFSSFQSSSKTQEPRQSKAGGELKKDPVCGTYVAASTGITRQIEGQTLYFCSTQCRDKYRAA
jgi:YHS domain-containing protein